jgi:hypothetical protein
MELKMRLESKKTLLIMIFTIIILLNITYWMGESEKEKYQRDFELFNYAYELIGKQEAGSAIPILFELNNRYQDDENIILSLAVAQVEVGEYDLAIANYQRSLEINPFLQLDPVFNLDYSRTLILNNEHEKAELLLEKVSNYKNHEQFSIRFAELYSLIEQKNN